MQIDIGQVLREKAPALARYIPRPAVAWLRRIVHEKELNRILAAYGHLPTLEFIRASLADLGITYHAEGMDRLDPAGRYIFASNHPFGGLDGLMLAVGVAERFGDVRVVVNDLLMNVAPLNPIFIPINKHGRQNPAYAKRYTDAFASAMPVVTFPAGLCSRRTRGVVADLPWKPNFIRRAVTDRRDVVPVHFEGELSNRFYRIASLRKRLGIKANIEMLFLVDEMFRQQGRSFRIRIGEPIPWQAFTDGQRPDAWCAEVRRRAYAL